MTSLILVVITIITLVATATATAFPIAKSGCEDRCGIVSIPYPFGIGRECSQNEQFTLECSSSNDGPVQPSFPGGSIITNISIEGQFRTLSSVVHDCYHRNGSRRVNYPRIRSNVDSFILNSTANKFTVIGCDTYAYIRGVTDGRNYTTGCMSICDKLEDVEDGSCSGIGCCQTSLPTYASSIRYSMGSYNNYTKLNVGGDFCSHAFVAESDAFKFYADNLTNLINVKQLPVVVNWVLERKTCREASPNACGENSSCVDADKTPDDPPSGYRCSCDPGYEGNPYLPQGCQDINECEDREDYHTPKNALCVNTHGNRTYHCNQGYHLDGEGTAL